MNNWSEIWLNEAFATFFVDHFLVNDHPQLTVNDYYLQLTQFLTKQVLIIRLIIFSNF